MEGPEAFRKLIDGFGNKYFILTIHNFTDLTKKYLKLLKKEYQNKDFAITFLFSKEFTTKQVDKLSKKMS